MNMATKPLQKNYNLIHHGGARGVTGSCHQLAIDENHSLMIDCGLFQGEDAEQLSTQTDQSMLQALKFQPQQIENLKGLILTHVHIDHVGRLPWLLATGYQGPIYCSEPSAHLLPLVLEDALSQSFTRKRRLIRRVLNQVAKQLRPIPYGKKVTLWPGVKLKLYPAGHILGSAYLTLDLPDGTRTLFSGDLGAPWSPILAAPRSPWRCDHLILESTYGDRQHQHRKQRRRLLEQALTRALSDRGTVLIPAFSLGRTQELLYELEDIIHRHNKKQGNLSELEIILDSPLAEKFTDIYRELQPYWDKEARRRLKRGRKPLAFENLVRISDHHTHQQTVNYLANNKRPALVIAASGMCAGGRIVNYLKAMLPDPRHNVLFVGYQAKGTPGRDIQHYGPRGGWVQLDGDKIDIRARIDTISGYSAHADQKNLLNFIRRMRHRPSHITLVHGDADAQHTLKQAIQTHWPEIYVETSWASDKN